MKCKLGFHKWGRNRKTTKRFESGAKLDGNMAICERCGVHSLIGRYTRITKLEQEAEMRWLTGETNYKLDIIRFIDKTTFKVE